MNDKVTLFKENSKILSYDDANHWRTLYIDKFINTKSKYYMEQIAIKHHFSDGECYIGYLWGAFKSWHAIKFRDINKHLPPGDYTVFVFWDINSKDRILIQDYWKFAKDDVIEVKVKDLLSNLDLLPEDIYIFDSSIEWSIALTHESEGDEDWPDSRIVFKAFPSNDVV